MLKPDFIDLVVRAVPQGFFTEVFQRAGFAISEARASVRNDTRFDQQEWVPMEGQIRYAMVFKQFRAAAERASLEWSDYGVGRGAFCYPVVTCKPFMFTISAVPAADEMPVASEYRMAMAEAVNAAWMTPKLRRNDREAIVGSPLYGIVVYTVPRVAGAEGFMGLGFPDDTYSEWLVLVSRDDLMKGYAARQADTEPETTDRVQPVLRSKQDEGK